MYRRPVELPIGRQWVVSAAPPFEFTLSHPQLSTTERKIYFEIKINFPSWTPICKSFAPVEGARPSVWEPLPRKSSATKSYLWGFFFLTSSMNLSTCSRTVLVLNTPKKKSSLNPTRCLGATVWTSDSQSQKFQSFSYRIVRLIVSITNSFVHPTSKHSLSDSDFTPKSFFLLHFVLPLHLILYRKKDNFIEPVHQTVRDTEHFAHSLPSTDIYIYVHK